MVYFASILELTIFSDETGGWWVAEKGYFITSQIMVLPTEKNFNRGWRTRNYRHRNTKSKLDISILRNSLDILQ